MGYETDDQKTSNSNITIQQSPLIPLTTDIIAEGYKNGAPPNWDKVYDGIYAMRSPPNGIAYNAEVDNIGAASLFDQECDAKTQRFHVLVSLLLSSQTKDRVTADAMYKLKNKFDGLTVDSICNVLNKQSINASKALVFITEKLSICLRLHIY